MEVFVYTLFGKLIFCTLYMDKMKQKKSKDLLS